MTSEKLRSRGWPNSRNSRISIGGVADEGEVVGNLRGEHAKLFAYRVLVPDPLPLVIHLNDAIATFKKATESKPDDALGYFNLGRTYELRYLKMRRYSQTEARWLSNPADLKNAIASYEQSAKIGGQFEPQAREAILRLQWMK